MDHIVYLDAKAKELENVLSGAKTMIIRGATGRKLPYGRVSVGDVLYFVKNNGSGLVEAKAKVSNVFNSEMLSINDSTDLVKSNQSKLQLNDILLKKYSGKRYLVLIEIDKIESLKSFGFNRDMYGNMDDWLPVEDINKVKK